MARSAALATAVTVLLAASWAAAQRSEGEFGASGAGDSSPAAPSLTPPEPLSFDPAEAGAPLGSFRLVRNDRTIQVEQYAPQAQGGQFRTNVPNCEADLRLSTVYAPAPWAVVTRVAETSIVSAVVIARRPPADEGGESRETLTMFGGSLGVDDGFCPTDLAPSGAQDVYIVQGRTLVSGTELLYENESGLAHLTGPVRLLRSAEGESPEIVAAAERLTFDVDTDLSTLEGGVVVSSGSRVSEADSLVLDEAAGLATLHGSPARSRDGDNQIEGSTLLYYLDTDDVIVIGGVSGTMNLESP